MLLTAFFSYEKHKYKIHKAKRSIAIVPLINVIEGAPKH